MKRWVTSGLVIALFLLACHQSVRAEEKPVSQMRLRGEAALQVPADQLNFSVGVVTEATGVDEALKISSKKMEGIIAALKRVGLKQGEYQTSRFDIQPQWSPRPKQAPADWKPRIVGYRVTSRLSVRTGKLEMAGKLIEEAVAAGANEVGSIYFDLADPRSHRAQAIETAAGNARADAQILAAAARVKIVRVLSISLDQSTPIPRIESFRGGMLKTMASDAATPPIESGDLTVRAAVELTCEIASNQ